MKANDARSFGMMKDLASNLPSTEEIIRALGLHNRSAGSHDVMPSVALFGAGILVGAGLALLFAPTSGRELREGISQRAADLSERASEAVESASSGENGQTFGSRA
jgi:hypothetical protein